jgi:hypothetical protein
MEGGGGNGVKIRRTRLRFTCDSVANETDTTVIILRRIVCVVNSLCGEPDNARTAGACCKEQGKRNQQKCNQELPYSFYVMGTSSR